MRFKSGSRVEVLTKNKVPNGVWRCAEVLSFNGDSYTVRYYRRPDVAKEGVDKVSLDAVRPCPPPVTDASVWCVGDVVEVLDGGYWKVSIIEEVLGEDCYQIRVIGSIDEFQVRKSCIRLRQEWKGNNWTLIAKDSENCEDMISKLRKKVQQQQKVGSIHVPQVVESSSKSLKRSFVDISSTDIAHQETVLKRRAVNKEADLDAIHGDSYSFTGKVDTHSILKVQSKHILKISSEERTGFSVADRQNVNDVYFSRTSTSDDCLSCVSSVGSCSNIDPVSDRVLSHGSAGCSQDADTLCSDADSSNTWGGEDVMSVGQRSYALRSQEFDLHSYRSFLEALYSFGALSWEEEVLLTDMRMKFNVSNDEHLMELRRLNCT